MVIFHTMRTSITALMANKGRSALTILGIVIGVMSIILIVAIGRGSEALILNQIGGFGAEMVVIRPGQEPKGPTDIGQTLFADSLKSRDVEALKRKSNVPHLELIAPAVIVPGSVSYRGETFSGTVFGWDADLISSMYDLYPAEGENFSDLDIKNRSSVAIIGSKVAEELFEGESALGKKIKIKDRNFRVVGVYEPRGQVAGFNMDELVLLPYSTAQTYLLGIDYYHEVIAMADSPSNVLQTVEDVERTLREMHDITDPEKDDFFVVTQEGIIGQVEAILGALTAFLSSVVAIALLVGGIGVMNIMLVSVTERTKEIGLRKAVGATNKDILYQFLIEAILLTVLGGVIGIALGFVLSLAATYGISSYLNADWVFSFPFSAAVLGVVVSALVGIVFGLYPARKASKKSPIEALRYE